MTWSLFNRRDPTARPRHHRRGNIDNAGIGGLTLGGGIGWLMGKHALALDNLRSVELVLADGSVGQRASEATTPICFGPCAVAGGNFVVQRRSNIACTRSAP